MSDHNWIVSRGESDSVEHKGDSLLWTALAMGVMDCDAGAPLEAALQKMLSDTNGALYRHPDLPDEWSLDGALGLYWGLSKRLEICGGKETWAPLFALHVEKVSLPPYFDTVRAVVASNLGLGDMPGVDELGRLGAEIDAWAIATVSQKIPAYRLHLGFLVLDTIAAPKSKATYCGAVKDAKIPLLEHFCSRPGLDSWLNLFAYNQYEYRHQRADWEAPDGDGLQTPGIDYLVGYREQLINR